MIQKIVCATAPTIISTNNKRIIKYITNICSPHGCSAVARCPPGLLLLSRLLVAVSSSLTQHLFAKIG